MKEKRHSLRLSLVLGFAGSCLVGLLAFGVLAQNIAVDSFHKIVHQNLVNAFAEGALKYYQNQGSWEGIAGGQQDGGAQGPPPDPAQERPSQGGGPQAGGPGQQRPPGDPQEGMRPARHLGVVDAQGRVVSRMEVLRLGEQVDLSQYPFKKALEMDGKVVGTVIEEGVETPNSWAPDEKAMVSSITQTLLMAGGIGLVLAVLLGAWMARGLTSPLEKLTQRARALKFGESFQPLTVLRHDEVGMLTQAFNQMSKSLSDSEHQRRQMIADIAHDLGTPLTVASGYIQSMHQGKLKPTEERLEVVYDELLLLQNLVDDLRLLSLADAGKLTLSLAEERPEQLLRGIQKAFGFRAEKQGVKLLLEVESNLPEVRMDLERMRQVLGNLVNNALQYTPEGGEICLVGKRAEGGVLLQVRDSGVGIASEKLPYIFERFYRVDEMRSPEGGGSGLGLAIARSIVELHGGKISASSVEKLGTTMHIHMPLLA